MRHAAISALLVCALPACLAAQRYAITIEDKQIVKFSDGYRTTARVSFPEASITSNPVHPILVIVPGLGSSHETFAREADTAAREGFFVVTYDVRGQASTKALNATGGSTLWSVDEWVDMAEIIEWVAGRWPQYADAGRIGVCGDSQGGVHAWAAAAYSGKPLPANSRRTKPFPKIGAVVPRIMAPQSIEVLVPNGTAFYEQLGAWIGDPRGSIVRFDPAFRAKAKSFLDKDDPAGMAAWLKTIPGKDFVKQLETTTVPTLCQMSWLDEFLSPDLAIEALASYPKSTPRRLFMSTGFHGTPVNTYQFIVRQQMTIDWFDHFLVQRKSGAVGGSPVVTAALPGDPRQYQLLQSLWRLRDDAKFPPADTTQLRFDLDVLGRMRSKRQDVFSGLRSIGQRVLKKYSWLDFARERGDLKKVSESLPVDRFEFRSSVLTKDLELCGSGKVVLRITPNSSDYQVGLRLFAQIPNGQRQLLTSGGRAFRGGPRTTSNISMFLGATNAVVPAGSHLVLEVANHVLQRPGSTERYRLQPMFGSFRFDMNFPAGRVASLELTTRTDPRVDLGTGIYDIHVTKPSRIDTFLQSSVKHANTPYFVLLSLSQPAPALLPGGRVFWFQRDGFTDYMLTFVNTPILPGFFGVTDARGFSQPQIRFDLLGRLPISLRGLTMRAAPILFPTSGSEAGATLSFRFR